MRRLDFILSSSAFAAAIAMNLACTKSKDSPSSSPDAQLDELVPRLLKESKTPGVSIAVVKDGVVTFNKGFGVKDTATNEPLDVKTTFEAASISKTVFAYAVMKLCEKEIMDLDTPLYSYYPELFVDSDPRFRIITARQVLSHTTGLPNARSSAEPFTFAFDPGKDFNYSGEGYYLLQSVLTHLAGKSFQEPCGKYEMDLTVCATNIDEYIGENILAPLGMNFSHYIWSEERAKNSAAAHDVEGKVINKPHQNRADMARYAAMGGLLTNAKDYSNFLISLFEGKENDPFRLSQTSLSEMVRPQVKLRTEQMIDGCSAWALGWGVQERPTGNVIVHSGGQSGFRSLTMADIAKKSGFVALTNGDNGGKVVYELANVLMA